MSHHPSSVPLGSAVTCPAVYLPYQHRCSCLVGRSCTPCCYLTACCSTHCYMCVSKPPLHDTLQRLLPCCSSLPSLACLLFAARVQVQAGVGNFSEIIKRLMITHMLLTNPTFDGQCIGGHQGQHELLQASAKKSCLHYHGLRPTI